MSDHSAMYEISVSIPHDPRPGRDHFDLMGRSCFNLSILVVLVVLSWLFQHVTVVLGFCDNGCPGFGRGYCGFADVDSGRPHRAHDGDDLRHYS